jgi:hypothetical protein
MDPSGYIIADVMFRRHGLTALNLPIQPRETLDHFIKTSTKPSHLRPGLLDTAALARIFQCRGLAMQLPGTKITAAASHVVRKFPGFLERTTLHDLHEFVAVAPVLMVEIQQDFPECGPVAFQPPHRVIRIDAWQ